MPFWSFLKGKKGVSLKKGKKSIQGSKVHDESIQSQRLLAGDLGDSSQNDHFKTRGEDNTPMTMDTSIAIDDSQNGNGSFISTLNNSFDYASEDESIEGYKEKIRKYGSESPQDTATCLNNIGYYYQQNAMSSPSSPASSPLTNRKYYSPGSSPMSVASSTVSADSTVISSQDSPHNSRKAEAAYKASLKIKKRELGKNHPSVATTMNNLASVHFAEGRYEKALKYYEKSVRIMIRHLGKEHLNVATVFNNIGDVHYALQNDEIAISCYSESLRIRRSCLTESDVRIKRLMDKIELIRWKQQIAESHEKEHGNKISPKRGENEVSLLKRELSDDLQRLTAMCDDLAGDMDFHVELISRKRNRREDHVISMHDASPLKKCKSINDEFMFE